MRNTHQLLNGRLLMKQSTLAHILKASEKTLFCDQIVGPHAINTSNLATKGREEP